MTWLETSQGTLVPKRAPSRSTERRSVGRSSTPDTSQPLPMAQMLPYGAAPHAVKSEPMKFDPLKGGWVPTGNSLPTVNPHWAEQKRKEAAEAQRQRELAAKESEFVIPRSRDKPKRQTQHFEKVHEGDFRLSMKYEADLGLAPPDWSVSSKMDDPRPNGKAIFDARFIESPVGRARAGRSMVWDPRGTANAGGTKKAENWDAGAMAMAAEEDFAGLEKVWDAQEGAGVAVRRASGF